MIIKINFMMTTHKMMNNMMMNMMKNMMKIKNNILVNN